MRVVLSDILYVFRCLPELAYYYRQGLLESSFLFLLSALSFFVEDMEWTNTPVGYYVFYAIRYGPIILFLLLTVTPFISHVYSVFHKSGMLLESYSLDAYYNKNYTFMLLQRFWGYNQGKSPIKDIYGFREGYYEEPSRLVTKCGAMDEARGRVVQISGPTKSTHRHTSANRAVETFRYEWIGQLDPPLQPRERYSWFFSVTAQGVEKGVLSGRAATIARIITVETREMRICVHAPPGYIIHVLDYVVNDESGNDIRREKKRLRSPSCMFDNTVLSWKIILPKIHYRYAIVFQLEELQ